MLASIGIKKGKPFSPDRDGGDPRRRGGNCQRHVARYNIRLARPADKELPDRQWTSMFRSFKPEFADGGGRTLDGARCPSLRHRLISPMMADPRLGKGAPTCTPPATRKANGSTAARPTR